MKSKGLTFQVRNQRREILGNYSVREILRRIASGRYTGEEEVSPPPYEKWQKISAHPEFYDAFLKRLFVGQYTSPDGEPSPHSESGAKPKSIRRTGRGTKGKTRGPEGAGEPDDVGRTRHLGDPKEFGATVHQSVIDELFSDGSSREGPGPDGAEPESQLEKPAIQATDLIKLEEDLGAREEPLPPLSDQLTDRIESPDLPAQEPAAAPPDGARERTKPKNRRVLIWGGLLVAIIIIYLLPDGKRVKGDRGREDASASQALRQLIRSTAPKEEQVNSLLEEGNLLRLADTPVHYRGAADVFREALELDGSNPQIVGPLVDAMARMLAAEFETPATIQDIQALLRQGRLADPHYNDYYRVDAMLALHQGRLDEARDLATFAIEADQGNYENAVVLGEIFYQRGELGEARRFFDESVKALPKSVRALHLRAKVALDLNELNVAQQASLKALELNAFHAPSYLILADIAAGTNRIDEAKSLYESAGRLARLAPRRVAALAYFRLGKLREQTGDVEGARRAYVLAKHYDSGASEELKSKAPSASRSLAEQLVAEEEFDADYFLGRGQDLADEEKWNEAVRFFQVATLLSPRDARAQIRLGEVMERVADSYNDFRRVINVYQRAIERDPSDPKGFVRLGLLESEQYNLNRASQLLKHAEEMVPRNEEGRPRDFDVAFALGKHNYKRKDYQEALEYFKAAVKMNNHHSETYYYAGMLRLLLVKNKDRDQDAMKFFNEAYTLDPRNYDALVEWLKLRVGSYEKNFAVKYVRGLMEQEPTNPNLYWVLGEVYAANKEHRRAISYYQRGLDLNNKSGKLRMALARSLEAVGDLAKATAEYRFASLLDRRNSDGFFRAAELLFQLKDFDSTEKVLKYLINLTPNYPGAHRSLSRVYEELRRKDEAIAEMEKEVANNPENVKFVLELAQLYMKYELHQKAVDELKKISSLPSINKAPEYVYDKIRAYLLLSRCYRALSRPESAEVAINLALEIDANDPELQREAGYVYYGLQRDKEGVKAFEEYLKRKPAAPDAQTIRGLINRMRIEQ